MGWAPTSLDQAISLIEASMNLCGNEALKGYVRDMVCRMCERSSQSSDAAASYQHQQSQTVCLHEPEGQDPQTCRCLQVIAVTTQSAQTTRGKGVPREVASDTSDLFAETSSQTDKEWTGVHHKSTDSRSVNHLSKSTQKAGCSVPRCVICFEKESVVACVPCGHVAYCSDCVSVVAAHAISLRQQTKCPVCRESVSATLRVYL